MRKGRQWREGERRGFRQISIYCPAGESRAVATLRQKLVASFLRSLHKSSVLEHLLLIATKLSPPTKVGSREGETQQNTELLYIPCSLAQEHLQ